LKEKKDNSSALYPRLSPFFLIQLQIGSFEAPVCVHEYIKKGFRLFFNPAANKQEQ
jgi:hypothetical protein